MTLDGPRTAPPPLLGSFRLGGPSAYLCKLGPFFKVPTKSSRNRGPRKESCIGFRRPAPKLLRKKGGPQLVWELGPFQACQSRPRYAIQGPRCFELTVDGLTNAGTDQPHLPLTNWSRICAPVRARLRAAWSHGYRSRPPRRPLASGQARG